MSGPNTTYDPVQVTPLNADEVEAMVAAALAAFGAATSTDELKAARLAHGIAVELGCHDGAGHALAEIAGALRELGARG